MLIILGWLAFSFVYGIGALGTAALFFGPEPNLWTLLTLIAALLVWGYFTAYLITASNQRHANKPVEKQK
jgi:hypothetical protein